jgi:hypothetical protein
MPSIGLVASGTGNILAFTALNSGSSPVVATLEVTPQFVGAGATCFGSPQTFSITVNPTPSLIDPPNQTICNETNTSLVTLNSSIPGNITYNWTAIIPSGISGATTGTQEIDTIPIQLLVNNTDQPLVVVYEAFATFNSNGNSCTGELFTHTVTVNPTLSASGVTSNYNGFNISVFGASDGFINMTTTGGSGNYNFSWSGSNGFTSNLEDISNLPAGIYTLSIDDGFCSPLILTFILIQPPELLVSADSSLNVNLLCFGDSDGAVGIIITQESVSPYNFQLLDNLGNILQLITASTNLNPQFTNLVAGVYSVVVTDANGGVKTVSNLTVMQPDDITINIVTTPITCYQANDASITLNVSGGVGPYEAIWANFASGLFQDNLAAGDYDILITDTFGIKNRVIEGMVLVREGVTR